jgi:hypothetical protein
LSRSLEEATKLHHAQAQSAVAAHLQSGLEINPSDAASVPAHVRTPPKRKPDRDEPEPKRQPDRPTVKSESSFCADRRRSISRWVAEVRQQMHHVDFPGAPRWESCMLSEAKKLEALARWPCDQLQMQDPDRDDMKRRCYESGAGFR